MPGLKFGNIKAKGFLSFEDIEIKDLNESVNFIVGPNGSGKTNFVKLIDFIKKAILNPPNFPYTTDIKNYLKKDSRQIKLDIDVELILSPEEIEFVSVATSMIFFKKNNKPIVDDPNNFVLSLQNTMIFFSFLWKEKFTKGKLIIEYDDVMKTRKILYKLANNEETIVFDIVNDLLVTGYNQEHYNEHQNNFSLLSDEKKELTARKISVIADNINNSNKDYDYYFREWLREDIKYSLLLENFNLFGQHNKVEEESGMIFNTIKYADKFFVEDAQPGLSAGTNRVSISTIFMLILKNSIIILDNFRCPSKNKLSIKEVEAERIFKGNNIYPYLLQLKINKFDNYKEIKETFKKLSNGKDFDIKIKEITGFSENTNIPLLSNPLAHEAQIVQYQNSVEVSVTDYKLELQLYFRESDGQYSEEYPFEFSPAGYYEILLLSTIIAGNNNKVIILDEPAQNLYPTLQHKLLLEIDKNGKENKNQFIVITHSPDLVKIDKESKKNIFIFRQNDGTTFINKFNPVSLDKIKFFKYEELKRLFFVKGVILAEGFSEEVLINRLIRNNIFFEKVAKNSNNSNNVNLGDIEVVNIEGIGSLMNFIDIVGELNLSHVAIIDEDIMNNNKKTKAKNNFMEKLEIKNEKELIPKLKNDYNVFFQSPKNFEGYIEKDFENCADFKENYLIWCKEKFGSNESECNDRKKTNYPLYLTEKDDIFYKIINADKLKMYSETVEFLIQHIH